MGVPNLPGVPALASYAPVASLASALLNSDSPVLNLGAFPSQWGIFNGGLPVVAADSVVSFHYKQEWAIADYPIEGGSFETYDKVSIPFDARFKFVAGGSEDNRRSFLDSIAAIANDKTTLFTVVTPEEVYDSVTVSHYDYPRAAAQGVGLIQADVWCLHVLANVDANFQNVQSPSAASPINGGTVQATATPSISATGAASATFGGPPEFPGAQ